MKTVARGIRARLSPLIVAGLAIVALASFGAPSFAQTPAKSLKDRLVGHWQLASVSVHNAAPYGAHPQGSMFFDAGGHYSIIVITGGAAKSISYFGTYTVNDAESSMTMHIEASSLAAAAGRDEARFITFSGDELVVANQKTAGPLGGIELTWKQTN